MKGYKRILARLMKVTGGQIPEGTYILPKNHTVVTEICIVRDEKRIAVSIVKD